MSPCIADVCAPTNTRMRQETHAHTNMKLLVADIILLYNTSLLCALYRQLKTPVDKFRKD